MSNRAVEVKSGFLTKCGGNFKNWKRRYFVLLGDGTLFYYKAKGDAQPLGTIVLDDCKVEKDDKRGKKFCFQISHPLRRTYIMYAATSEEMNSWIETLQTFAGSQAIKQVQAIAVGVLSKEGETPQATYSDSDSSDDEEEGEGEDSSRSLPNSSVSTRSEREGSGGSGPGAGDPSSLMGDTSPRNLSEQERKRREEFEKAKNDLSKAIAFGRKSPVVNSAAKRRVTVGSYSALKSGWLTKCGGSYKNWKKRFFVLRPNLLYYYQKKHDKMPRGIIPLDDCSVDVCSDTAILQREHCFKIYHPLRRVYYIEAPNAEEMQRWMNAIDSAIRATPIGAAIVDGLMFAKNVAQGGLKPDNSYHKVAGWVGTLKGIDKKGYLSSKVSKKWHRHYFALKANVLYEFDDEAAEEPKVAVDLKGYFLVPLKKNEEKKKHVFMLQHPEEGRLVFHLMADTAEEMSSWMEHLQSTINKETEVELDSFE